MPFQQTWQFFEITELSFYLCLKPPLLELHFQPRWLTLHFAELTARAAQLAAQQLAFVRVFYQVPPAATSVAWKDLPLKRHKLRSPATENTPAAAVNDRSQAMKILRHELM